MKNYLIYIPVTALVLAVILSCEKEPDLRYPETPKTVTVFMMSSETSSTYIDFNDPSTFNLQFDLDVMYDDPFQKISILVARDGDYANPYTVLDDITTVPQTISITAADLVAAVPSLNSVNDIGQGEQYNFYPAATLSDGTFLPNFNKLGYIAVSPAVRNTLNNVHGDQAIFNSNIIVPCASNLAGTYSVVANGTSTDPGPSSDENPAVNYTSEVTLEVADNFFTYTISDFSGGLYPLWYDIYGFPAEYPGTLMDVCGSISYVNTVEFFGSPIAGSGTVDPVTGVITLNGRAVFWGDTWSLVLTPVVE
jgi:hypothetical protein